MKKIIIKKKIVVVGGVDVVAVVGVGTTKLI